MKPGNVQQTVADAPPPALTSPMDRPQMALAAKMTFEVICLLAEGIMTQSKPPVPAPLVP